MCPKPRDGEKSTCNKRPFSGFPRFPLFPREGVEGTKKDAEKKVEQTNKLPVLKF